MQILQGTLLRNCPRIIQNHGGTTGGRPFRSVVGARNKMSLVGNLGSGEAAGFEVAEHLFHGAGHLAVSGSL